MDGKKPEPDQIRELLDETQAEFEQVGKELKEISLLVEQSRSDVGRLAQRHATAANQLRNVQLNFDSVPRADIKNAYESAQDAQQRLITLRGQLDKLQSDQANLERYRKHLRRTLSALETAGLTGAHDNGHGNGASAILQIVEAQEAERQRLSRQMHDGPAQDLSNFILQAEIAMRLMESDQGLARQELTNLRTSASGTFQKLRDFIFDLRPMMLDDLGLVPTIRRYVDSFAEKSSITTHLLFTGVERRFDPLRELLVFRGVQELLTNSRDNSKAGEIKVTLDLDERMVQIILEDDGRPLELDKSAPGPRFLGLSGLRERVELAGGEMEVHSQPGHGTRVRLAVPASQSPFASKAA